MRVYYNRNNVVKIHKGDDINLLISNSFKDTPLEDETIRRIRINVELKKGDEILLHIMEPNDAFDNALVEARAVVDDEEEEVTIPLKHEDTKHFIANCNYWYEIKLIRDNKWSTILSRTKFIVED